MAAVSAPPIKHKLHVPAEVIAGYKLDDGTQVGISDLQLEAVALAGQAHSQTLPDGTRRGVMIGDGTGVGKAREIAGIILDNWNQGRKRAVWISKNKSLLEPARDEWKKVGGDPAKVVDHSKFASGHAVDTKEGILFSTYTTLAQDASDKAKQAGNTKTRLEQIVDWLGEDFDGVIVFDESHMMGSALDRGKGFSKKKAAAQALAGVDLQAKLPNARVVYLSATSATEVENLAYASRLGLWGEGTAFANREKFVDAISSGGVAAMEKVAADMKAMGMYVARNIAFNDGTEKGTVTYDRIEHELTPDQVESYNKMAEAWAVVLGNMTEALELTGGDKNGMAVGNARGQFWSANQRFWNQVITAMQTPAILQAIEKDLAEGRSAVVQLTNTNEAAQKRALADREGDEDLSDVDVSPKYILMDYIERSFPTSKYEEYTDEQGNVRTRQVKDSEGNPVKDPAAEALKENLLDQLGSLQVANRGALDMILDHFGEEQVAEITGRSERLVTRGGKTERQKRTPSSRKADANLFMDGKKRILVFSEAGGTGSSYHADLSKQNQQKRHHYLLQAGWRADAAIQGLGRTHRSNQAQAPKYFLIHTNLKGQKRFISTIAKRLAQLGALTKGSRQAGESGVFSAADNLESTEAREAVVQFYRDAVSNQIEGVDLQYMEDTLGLQMRDKDGNLRADLPPITQFMNRVLSLPVEAQNHIFDEFQKRLDSKIEQAQQMGTLDQGLETVRADRIVKESEQVVYTHETGAEAKHVVVKVFRKTKPKTWEQAQNKRVKQFVKSEASGKVFAVEETGQLEQDKYGSLSNKLRFVGPTEMHYSTQSAVDRSDNWTELSESDAEQAWNDQLAKVPAMHEEKMHILSGVLLPVWDRLPQGTAKVFRLLTEDGEQILGRVIPKDEISRVLKNLGVSADSPSVTPEEAIEVVQRGGSLSLVNGWKVKRSRVDGEWTIELVGPQYTNNPELERQGVFWRRINFNTRYFIPTGTEAAKVLGNVVKHKPIADVHDPNEMLALKKAGDVYRQSPTRQRRSEKATGASEEIASQDIIKTWERLFDVPIRAGGFSRRAAGFYKVLPEVVRVKERHVGNLAVAAHEVAHHIDKQTGISDSIPDHLKNQVAGLDYEPRDRVFEGFAEFVRHYITEHDAQTLAPEFYDWFTSAWMPENPKWAAALKEAKAHARKYADQSVFQRIRAQIGYQPGDDLEFNERWSREMRGLAGRTHRALVDRFSPLKFVQEEAAKRGMDQRAGVYDVAMAYDMSSAPNAMMALEKGVHSIVNGKLLGKKRGLWKLADELKTDAEYDEAVAYAYARHTLHMAKIKPGFNTGLDVEDAQGWLEYVKSDADKAGRFERFAKGLAEFNNDLLEMLVDAGALDRDGKNRMVSTYGTYYMPLQRSMEGQGIFASSGARFVNLPPAVRGRSRSGSGRKIIDPLDATIARATYFYGRAAQARVAHRLARTLDPQFGGVEGLGGLMDRIDPKKKVHEGVIEEILDTLVHEGILEADEAKSMRIAAQILGTDSLSVGSVSDAQLAWFADHHGLELDDEAGIQAAAEAEPDVMATISLWRADYTPNAVKATVVIHDRNGKPVLYEMDRELYKTVTGMDELQFRGFWRVLRGASRYFKSGAVGLSTGFGTANLFRDYLEYQGKAEHVQGLATLGKPMDMLQRYVAYKARQYAGQPTDDALITTFEEMGGKIYSRIGHDVHSRARGRRQKFAKSWSQRFGISASAPGETLENALEAMQETIAVSDAPPRLAEMLAVAEKNGYTPVGEAWHKDGKPADLPEWLRIQMANAAAEATVNFKRAGWAGRYVESFVPFFNATVQAAYRQGVQLRSFRRLGQKNESKQDRREEQAAKRALVYFSALAATSFLVWMLRHDDDDYREQEDWLKDGYWTWGKNGITILRIPKPRDAAIVANVTETILDGWHHKDSRSVLETTGRDFLGRVPTGGGLLRGGVEALVANYDYFRGRDLVPEYLQQKPKQLQSTPYTLETSKKLGQFTGKYLGISPIQAEHLLDSATGGAYRRLVGGAEAVGKGEAGPQNVPFVRGLVVNRHQGRSVQDFYDKKDELGIASQLAEAGLEETDSLSVGEKALFDDYADLMAEIRKVEPKSLGGKRKFEYEPYIVGLARDALGYAPLPHNPNPFYDPSAPAPIKQVLMDHATRNAKRAVLSEGMPTKVHKGDATYQETLSKWRARRKSAEAWLKEHRASPLVQETLDQIRSSQNYRDLLTMRKEPQYTRNSETFEEHLADWDRWMAKADQARKWLGDPD